MPPPRPITGMRTPSGRDADGPSSDTHASSALEIAATSKGGAGGRRLGFAASVAAGDGRVAASAAGGRLTVLGIGQRARLNWDRLGAGSPQGAKK
eukprot:5651225-Prymnesium_polylepis.1